MGIRCCRIDEECYVCFMVSCFVCWRELVSGLFLFLLFIFLGILLNWHWLYSENSVFIFETFISIL